MKTLRLPAAAHTGEELEVTALASHFVRVRGGREYRIKNPATGRKVAEGIAELVYVDRKTGAPKQIPPQVGIDLDVPAKGSATMTVEDARNVTFYCKFHPGMTGTLVVTP